MNTEQTVFLKKSSNTGLFNPEGDTDLRLRRIIGGNSTNLNDFNNLRYKWMTDWYRQAMNNFWIPEEINLTQDTKDYRLLKHCRTHRLRQDSQFFGFSGFAAKQQPAQHQRIYNSQRS